MNQRDPFDIGDATIREVRELRESQEAARAEDRAARAAYDGPVDTDAVEEEADERRDAGEYRIACMLYQCVREIRALRRSSRSCDGGTPVTP